MLCSHRSSHALQFVLIFLTINKIHGCFITQHPLWPVDLSFWLPYSHHSAPFPSAAPIPLPVSEMVLSCGSLHRGSAYWALAMWKQRAGSSGPNGVAVTVEESFTAPDPVFFYLDDLVVYCSAVAAWLSTGLICHPMKKQDTAGTQQSGTQRACYVGAWMEKMRGQIGRL